MTTVLLLVGVAVFAYFIVRTVFRIASWRIVFIVLALGILGGTGLVDVDGIFYGVAGEVLGAFTAVLDVLEPSTTSDNQ